MFEVFSLLAVLLMSLVITRVATVALTLTGMSHHAARFQARSALTGAGFTTSESERVVDHPLRRRIIMWLMLMGNTGLVLAASLMVVFIAGSSETGFSTRAIQLGLFLTGLLVLYAAARSRWVERVMARWIERLLDEHSDVAQRDYASLLHVGGGYRVAEMKVNPGDWIAGRSLAALQLSREGVLVLGVRRGGGEYEGAPRGETTLEPGDTALLYGREAVIADLDARPAGVGGHLRHNEVIVEQRET
jgi:hypothetical protein